MKRCTDNTMAKKKKDRQYNGQKEEGQTIQLHLMPDNTIPTKGNPSYSGYGYDV
jgi:hypothetical protein